MKILQLSAVKDWGGGENHLENLCFELQDFRDVDNIVLCVHNGRVHHKLKNTSTPFFTAPLLFKVDFRFIIKLGKICEQQKVDLIHIHDPTALTLAVMADRFFDLPPFVFSKKTSFPIKPRKQTLFKYNYPKIRSFLCVSKATSQISAEAIKDRSKLKVIYHGTRLSSKSDKTPFKLREKYNLPQDKFIIGNIANHIRAKNLETLINVADLLINQYQKKDFFFVQIGGFTERTRDLLFKVRQQKLEKHIVFLDFIPNASNFIPQFDLTLITSQSEGIPQVVYESFFHKVPVISTDAGGIPEIIHHGENGLLAEKQDARGLVDLILYLCRDRNLQEKFTETSRKKVLEFYTSEIMAQQTLAEYQKITNGKS